ncbi:long-chain-fatty-acid--CoA ligase [Streptomyces olivochromogenes]|uniref:Long-chain-fatty-acid--CoA ligase n=1 Tax=Streptomyces olivochromogenes TaxID=1963 RepID=A0A250VM97_STROL|nr:long-chain fatty acid--CoA ligase [Streptomyces olivochromogenes]KUN41722.1 long-chain fatty acid--CoA ligase [Streptomyces olivochromogenes]GAX55338.1 long-chain-fatty-acid--CoA ligase [Streptomyces olivochromogenes]
MNLASRLVRSARTHPDRAALRLEDAVVSYRTLDQGSAHMAGLLDRHGVKPGDRVAIMLPNVPEFALAYFGVLRAGGIVVPMNPLLKSREVAYYLGDSGARLLFAWHAFADEARAGAQQAEAEVVVVSTGAFDSLLASAPSVEDVADLHEDDTAVILYTSGTTGQPKGAELTHANLTRNCDIARELVQLTADDVIFGGLPLFHAFGQTCTLNAAVGSGACLTLLPRFDAGKALGILGEHGVTVFAGVPTVFSRLVREPDRDAYPVSRLRVSLTGGAAMPVQVLHDFQTAFDCAVLEGYGLSETSPIASFNTLQSGPKPGSVGTPIRGVEMRVVANGTEVPQGESGEITIRGHNVMKRYWQRPEETAAAIRDGWLYTGDIGRVDQDGYFWIIGRTKDVIIRGGYNVYPREVEDVLYEHPAVADAAVIGLPSSDLGEEVGAAVVLKPGARTTAEELREYVKHQVAAYKYPRKVWITDALPKGPTGKILKRQIVPPPELDRR